MTEYTNLQAMAAKSYPATALPFTLHGKSVKIDEDWRAAAQVGCYDPFALESRCCAGFDEVV